MREIKFRCWDKKNNRMLPPVDAWGFGEGAETFFDNTLCIYKDEVVLQQYTGLKDKNGVEIYEGDLIRNIYWNGQYEVKYQELRVWPDEAVGIGFEFPSVQDTGDDIEVVGNIFEGVKQ